MKDFSKFRKVGFIEYFQKPFGEFILCDNQNKLLKGFAVILQYHSETAYFRIQYMDPEFFKINNKKNVQKFKDWWKK